MQYLFPLFNYTSNKNKSSHSFFIFPTPFQQMAHKKQGLILCLLHTPALKSSQWLGWRTESFEQCIIWGNRSQLWDHKPQEAIPAPSAVCCRVPWRSGGKNEMGLVGWLKTPARGRIMSANQIRSGLLLASSVAANSYWPHVREQLLVPLRCPSVQDAEQMCKRCRGWSSSSHGWASTVRHLSAWPCCARESKLVPQSVPGPCLGHRPPDTLLLGPCISALLPLASRVFGEQKQDRRQIHAKGDGRSFSSWSLGVANLGEKVELIRDTVCSCTKMHSLYVYIHLQRSKESSLLCSLITTCFQQKHNLTKLQESS